MLSNYSETEKVPVGYKSSHQLASNLKILNPQTDIIHWKWIDNLFTKYAESFSSLSQSIQNQSLQFACHIATVWPCNI